MVNRGLSHHLDKASTCAFLCLVNTNTDSMTRTIGSCRIPISGIVSFVDCPPNITDQFAKVCDSQQREACLVYKEDSKLRKACLVCKEDSKLRKVCLVCKEDCQEEGLPVFFLEKSRGKSAWFVRKTAKKKVCLFFFREEQTEGSLPGS